MGGGGLGGGGHGARHRRGVAPRSQPSPPQGGRGLNLHTGDHDGPIRLHKPEQPPVGILERRARIRSERHRQRRVRAIVAEHQPDLRLPRLRSLGGEISLRLSGQAGGEFTSGGKPRLSQRPLQPRLPQRRGPRLADAPRGQQRGVFRAQHLAHAQSLGHRVGDLAGRAAERDQGVAAGVEPALGRDAADRLDRLFDGDGDEPFRRRLHARRAHLTGQRLQRHIGRGAVQRLVGARAEDRGKPRRIQPAQHQIGVGDGRRPASPVTGGPRISSGAGRPHAGAQAVEGQDRAAAGRHRLHIQHGRADPRAGDHGPVLALERSGKAADIRRGAAHIEPQHGLRSGRPRGLGDTDRAASGAREDGVPPAKGAGPNQSAARTHEPQGRPAHGPLHPPHIVAQHRGQIGVGHRGFGARQEAGQGADFVRDADMGEPGGPGQLSRPLFMDRVQVGVQEGDGATGEAFQDRVMQAGGKVLQIKGLQHQPIRRQPLTGLDRPLIKRLWLDDVESKQLGPRLVPDDQRIAKPPRGDEQGPGAPPLQQGVGRDRRAHLDGADLFGGERRARRHGQQAAHALDGGVLVVGGLGQELGRADPAARRAHQHIGKGAAAIDPELQPRLAHPQALEEARGKLERQAPLRPDVTA